MTRTIKSAIKFHPLAAGVMLACGASFTHADPTLEEVTVTAQKREQSLQEVPVAVTAIGEAALIENGVSDITDIQKLSPNTTLQVSRGTNTTLTAFIRGVGQQDPLWGFEPGVGIYVDDVYIARPQGAVLDILDVERVEVLRGPQGTLYGKNTIGGAVKYVTKKMSGDSRVSVSGALGSYNQRDLKVAASTEIADGVYLGGAIASFQRDGYGENVITGDEQYNKDIFTGRVALEFNPGDDLWIRLAADQTRDDSAPKHGYREETGPNGEPVLDSVYDTEAGMLYDNSVETSGASLTVEWQLSDSVMVKSITAQREGTTETSIDFDSRPAADFDVPAYYDDEQFSQELQLNWEGDTATLVSGLYYYTGTAAGHFNAVLGFLNLNPDPANPIFPVGLTQLVGGSVDTDSLSVYAHYNWNFAADWNLSLGGRYSRDEKTADVLQLLYAGLYSPEFQNEYFPQADDSILIGTNTDYSNSDTWSEFTPHVGLDYQLNEDIMAYATFSTGFKSGGFDMRGNARELPATVDGFDPEMVKSYELGAKADLFGNRLRLNGALFYADYTDMQVTSQSGNPTGGFTSAILNAGKAKIRGLEVEASLAVSENLLANLTLGLADAEFVEFINRGVDVSDQRNMQNTPDTTAMFQLNYSLPMQSGAELVVNPSVSYRADTQIFETPNPRLDQDAYTLVDMSATYYSADGSWNLSLVGKNLTDKEYRIAGYAYTDAFARPGLDTGFYGAPRTIALTGSYHF